jgi:hypothetical protein
MSKACWSSLAALCSSVGVVIGVMVGRALAKVSFHSFSVGVSAPALKALRKGLLSPLAGESRNHSDLIPQWSDPRDASQSKVGGVIDMLTSRAQLCQVRSRVLGRSLSRPSSGDVPGLGVEGKGLGGRPLLERRRFGGPFPVLWRPCAGVEIEVSHQHGRDRWVQI